MHDNDIKYFFHPKDRSYMLFKVRVITYNLERAYIPLKLTGPSPKNIL